MSNDISVNRQAFHNYDIIEKFEAGMVLTGTEIKSARDGRVNLKDAYGLVKAGEVWLLNCHISPYSHGNYANHDPLRTRKLLLNRSEINRPGNREGPDPRSIAGVFKERQVEVRTRPGQRTQGSRQARSLAAEDHR